MFVLVLAFHLLKMCFPWRKSMLEHYSFKRRKLSFRLANLLIENFTPPKWLSEGLTYLILHCHDEFSLRYDFNFQYAMVIASKFALKVRRVISTARRIKFTYHVQSHHFLAMLATYQPLENVLMIYFWLIPTYRSQDYSTNQPFPYQSYMTKKTERNSRCVNFQIFN